MAEQRSKQDRVEGEGSDATQRMSPSLIRALDNATRRETLRSLHRQGEASSAIQLSKSIDTDATNISYHLKILSNVGAVSRAGERQVRAVPEKLFTSAVASHRKVVSILADTEQDDAWLRK